MDRRARALCWPAPRAARAQAGSLTTSLAVLVALGFGLFWGVGQLDLAKPFRSRADRVAAAAAGAGAMDGPEAAWLAATASGATLVAFDVNGPDAVVTVDVAGVRAVGRARRKVDSGLSGGGGAGREGLAPELAAAVARADQLLGRPLPITSGLRSTARQAALFAARASNPFPVAPPGLSKHESGQAIDVRLDVATQLGGLSAQTGLCRPYPLTDPVHFERCG